MLGEFCLIGFVVGILLGFVLRRGFFCVYSGLTNMVITKDYRIIKAIIWAFLVTMIGFHSLASLGIITLDPKAFFAVASVLGAIFFAIGMVLAGSCIVGTPLRAASGIMGYWLTLLGMGIGGWLVIWGPLTSFRKETLQEASRIMIGDKNPTIDALLGVNHWFVVVVLALISIWLLIKLKSKKPAQEDRGEKKLSLIDKIFKGLWMPATIGISLGIIGMIAFVSGQSPAGLGGFIKGYAFLFKSVFVGSLPWGWPVAEVVGILLGVFIAAVIAKEFKIIWPKPKQIPRLFFGGFFMGMGAVIAVGGCNVAHIISQMPQLSIGSFVSGITIIAVAWLIIYFSFTRKED